MLLFLILLILINASIFVLLYFKLNEVEDENLETWSRLKKLEQRLFGEGSNGEYLEVALAFIADKPLCSKKGILPNFKDIVDKNNDYFNTRIKALENFLKVEYIDEKKIVNGREVEAFKGYRQKAKK